MKPFPFTRGALRTARETAAFGLIISAFGYAGVPDLTGPEAPAAVPGIEAAFESRLASIDATSAEAAWTYINRWDFPLAVERFEESCTCLRGKAAGEPVEPGKSGVIRAAFSAGPHRGLVRKSLHVRFVGHDKPVELVAEARIPSSVTLSSHDLVWPADDLAAELSVDLTAGTDADFRITALRGLAPAEFAVRAETLVEGRHYRLVVTPGPSAPASATRCLQIRTDSPDPRDRVLAVFLRTGAPATPPQPSLSEPSSPTAP